MMTAMYALDGTQIVLVLGIAQVHHSHFVPFHSQPCDLA